MGLSWQLILMSLAAGIAGNFQLGYLAAVLSQPYVAIERMISSSWAERTGNTLSIDTVSVIMSALNIVNPVAQVIGQLIAMYVCDRIGRKRTALLGCLLIIPGCLLSFGAKYLDFGIELLFIGRTVWSLAVGILVVNQTIWLVEAAPARYRGRASSMQEFFAAFGSLTAQAFGVPFSTDELWPLMFVFPLAINVFCMVAFFVVHESPHYLLFKCDTPNKTRKAIAAYHRLSDAKAIDEQYHLIKMNGASSSEKKDSDLLPKANGMDILFRPWKANDDVSKVLRHGAWIGVMVKLALVFSGARVFRAFGTYILKDLGGWEYTGARYAAFVIGLVRLPASLVPVFFVDKIGRRPLLLWSSAATLFCLLLSMVSIHFGESMKYGTLTGSLLLQIVSAIGLGSLSRFYGAELVPRKLLLKAVSTLAILEAVVRILPEFSFYPLAHIIGGYYFVVFLIPTALFLFLMWYYCPETKGRAINDVLNDMAKQKGLGVMFHVAETKPLLEQTSDPDILPTSSSMPVIISQWGVDFTPLPIAGFPRCKSWKKMSDAHGKLSHAHGKLSDAHGKLTDVHGKLSDEHGELSDAHGKLLPGRCMSEPGFS